jgi:hypothetical protein
VEQAALGYQAENSRAKEKSVIAKFLMNFTLVKF